MILLLNKLFISINRQNYSKFKLNVFKEERLASEFDNSLILFNFDSLIKIISPFEYIYLL